MHKTKLIALLERLDGYQWRNLEAFILSPFFNTNEEVNALFAYLYAFWKKEGGLQKLERTSVYTAVYPERKYQYQRLNQLMSHLLKLAEKWLVVNYLEEEPVLMENFKARQFLKMKLDKHFRSTLLSAEKKLQQLPASAENYYHQYQIKDLSESYFTSLQSRKHHPALKQASRSLDDFFVLQKLKYYCEMLNRQRLTDHPYELSLQPIVTAYLDNEEHQKDRLIQLYTQLFTLLSAIESHAHSFDHYVEHLYLHRENIHKAENQNLWYYAINYCIGQIREGDRSFAPRLFGLYSEGLTTGILLNHGQLSPWTFKNMVKLGLNLKRYSWVESFVKEYADCLPEREMQDALYYNLAELYFFQGKYDAALSQLRHVEFTDVHYKLGGRALLAKIYYEQGQWEALEALLNAFRVFLRRNQAISGEVKAPYRKFIQVITAMVRGLPDSYGPLIRKVRANKAINNRDWLLAQMENV